MEVWRTSHYDVIFETIFKLVMVMKFHPDSIEILLKNEAVLIHIINLTLIEEIHVLCLHLD